MDFGSIFLFLALLAAVALFVSRPFLKRQPVVIDLAEKKPDEHERSALMAERDRILNALQELDFDHLLGKIPEEDYPRQRAVLLQWGADILRKLDTLAEAESDDAEERIEAAIRARGALSAPLKASAVGGNGNNGRRGVSASVAEPDDALEVMLAERRRARQEKAAGFCPKCGKPVQKSDHFCPKCGAKL